MKVVICTPTITKPHPAYLSALEGSVPLLDGAGIEHQCVFEIGCPYISGARATMLRRAMAAGGDVFVFIDHDVSWAPGDLLTLIQSQGDVVGGTYRYKLDDIQYMGNVETDADGLPIVRDDGCIRAFRLPAGFLKVTRAGVDKFMAAYPHLTIRSEDGFESPDLFNHGAHKGTWFGEDYAFCRNWIDAGGEVWLIPDMNLDHHSGESVYRGNFHEYLLRCPGGSKSDCPRAA